MSTDQVLEQAHDKLDRNDFVGARDDYRSVMLKSPEGLKWLGNLSVAEKEECLAFRRELRNIYPDSYDTWMSEAMLLVNMRRWDRAVKLFSEMLDKFGSDKVNEFRIRSGRLEANLKAIDRRHSLIVDDVQMLWDSGNSHEVTRKIRQFILNTISKDMSKNEDVPVLEKLAESSVFPPSVKNFFEIKMSELKALYDAIGDVELE